MRSFLVLFLALCLAGCGGGSSSGGTTSSSSSSSSSGGTTTTLTNTTQILMDGGPSALGTNTDFNAPFVTVTICAPGSTTNCQTIDHVLLDTGSVGLRIIQPVINSTLLAALPTESDSSGNAVGECYQYVTSYVFGSVRLADFTIGGEKVASMPFQAIGDTGNFANVPSSCSQGAGTQTDTVASFGANAIMGIGSTETDCGTICTSAGGESAAIYYDCPTGGCSNIIGVPSTTSAPFGQLPNPVAAFATDNNGTIITLPSVPQAGVISTTGTLIFGIGTQTNNTLSASNILTLTTSTNNLGPGLLNSTFNGQVLNQSFLDTGSNFYYFVDNALTACTGSGLSGLYCPSAATLLSPTITGQNNVTVSGAFTLYNPNNIASTANVAPGIGANPSVGTTNSYTGSSSFDFGLPFFFGKTVYNAIEGRTAGSTAGPFVAW